jgi:pimeloyl-ACP methyl ester carboxylesterase
VLFAHGFGQNRHAWRSSAGTLAAAGFRSLLLDVRGHGESSWNAPELDYQLDQFVDDLLAVAATCDSPPVMVGASLGGLLALLAQRDAPDAFRALILVDITPRWEAEGVKRILGFMGAHPDGFADYEDAAEQIAAYLPHRRERKTPAQLSSLLVSRPDGRLRWHWDPRLLNDVARDGERHQEALASAARSVRVPTLLISGGRSDLVSEQTVSEFLDMVSQAQHVQIDEATHMVAGDSNDRFTAAILDFLTAPAVARAPTGALS